MKQERIQQLLECISAANEAANKMYSALQRGSIPAFSQVSGDLRDLLLTLEQVGKEQSAENNIIKLGDAAESTLDSLDRIVGCAKINIPLALHKIEFELTPFIATMYAEYYFWSSIFPYREKWDDYFKNEMPDLYSNPYIEQSIAEGKYKYDLSILIVGYNKLDYTKMCVKSVLEHLPKDISVELILLNHGSTDGTKEYFESVKPTKQMDVKISGSLNVAYGRIIEGEFYIGISNDTIMTPNALDNMLRAMREDESIGSVVPSTPNVSNLQTISSSYSTLDELMLWAKENNVYDPFRHEVRTRLCDPMRMSKSSTLFSKSGVNMYGRYYSSADFQSLSFPDDEVSMLLRRAGLKNVLAKDAYCHHFGSITINDQTEKKQMDVSQGYINGRKDFKRAFGIDPWGTGFCYDPDLYIRNNFDTKFDGHIEILGINCGMGSNSLKIKELYKELKHNIDVYLTNTVDEEILLSDIRAYSDEMALVKSISQITSIIKGKKYHYIVLEDAFGGKAHRPSDIDMLADCLLEGGELYVKSGTKFSNKKFKEFTQIGAWFRYSK